MQHLAGETVPLNTIKTLLDHKENMYSLFFIFKNVLKQTGPEPKFYEKPDPVQIVSDTQHLNR
jgi:hypothetical protein